MYRCSEDKLDRLTDRERAILDLMAQGRTNAAIARTVYCSTKTLEAHIRSIFTKLELVESPHENRRVVAVVHYLLARRGPEANVDAVATVAGST